MPGLITFIVLSIKHMTLLLSYIKNNAFPQPLSDTEEKKQLHLMSKGDAAARNMLIEHNLRLVAHMVKKFDNTGEDVEDLISIGTIGLIKAIESFKPDKGTKLATYAARCVENEILMHLRALKKSKKDISLNDPIGQDKEGNDLSLLEILGTDENEISDQVEIKMERHKIYHHLTILDDREKAVIVHRFGLDKGGEERTQREIAKAMGISRSYVSRIEKRALMKLYHEFYRKRH